MQTYFVVELKHEGIVNITHKAILRLDQQVNLDTYYFSKLRQCEYKKRETFVNKVKSKGTNFNNISHQYIRKLTDRLV
ncbi:hypothetical protein ACP8HZ_07160 [Francisella noatunensis]